MDDLKEREIRKKIDAYIKGQLSEDDTQKLWVEFAKKPELLEDLEIEVAIKEIISRQLVSQKQAKRFTLPKYTWQAAAAAVLLIAIMVQFFRVETPTSMNDFVVEHISAEQIETADGIRAKDLAISTADSLLNLGFEAFISGNDDRALELYNQIIKNYPEEPYLSKAYLNIGIIHYNDGNYEKAIPAFQQAADRSANKQMITEKAYWYLGNALVNTDKLEEARKAVYKAYAMEGIFREPAFLLLQKINNDLGNYDFEPLESDAND
ncbi:MAG: tetratricopeptide repeat protein [Balneolaceae bacterium]|nr:tetratricopeptide repeat protein [Balneolaceae bacterium]